MASIGHIAVGMAAARIHRSDAPPRWPSLAFWSAISLLPDIDVIGFALGVAYADPWGHRGATHSLAASIAVALVIGLIASWIRLPVVRTTTVAGFVLTSHAFLDTMTDGGLGCALLWPFDLTRYFAPWRPIPVAPIGLDFFSQQSVTIVLTELVLFAPALVFALRPPPLVACTANRQAAARSRRSAREISLAKADSRNTHRPMAVLLLALWLVSAWLITSTDPVRESIVGFILREDTVYASGFSERAFRTIGPGMSASDARHRLGTPLGETWLYTPRGMRPDAESAADLRGCWEVRSDAAIVTDSRDRDQCRNRGVESGAALSAVEQRLGAPSFACWRYTSSPSGTHYRARVVCVSGGRVVFVVRQWE